MAPEVAARLDPDKEYGVQWYNRQRVTSEQYPSRTATAAVATGRSGRSSGVPGRVDRHTRPRLHVPRARRLGAERDGRQRAHERKYLAARGSSRHHALRVREEDGTRTTQLKSGHRYYYYLCPRAGKRAYTCKQKCLRAEKVEERFGISSAGCSSIQSDTRRHGPAHIPGEGRQTLRPGAGS